jgi:Lon protease-like protein
MYQQFYIISFILCCWFHHPSVAWLMTRDSSTLYPSIRQQQQDTPTSIVLLKYSSSNGDKNKEEDEEERRMKAVRSLQVAFYETSQEGSTSPDAAAMTRLEAKTGKLLQLPLWRAPWWEVPGRSNVLNVHDPIYTNMFEAILRSAQPWCFGHIYLEGGSENLKAGGLPTLDTYDDTSLKKKQMHSAVIGCLLKIQDYRRFSNGRLLLLVHAMERFVVTDIHQELPYSIADAQIIPDVEELDPSLTLGEVLQLSETDLSPARGLAVQESVRHHDYEYDPYHDLSGVANKTYLEPTDILWSAIARVLPYCPYSKELNPPPPANDNAFFQCMSNSTSMSMSWEETPTLEYKMLQKGATQSPLMDPDFDDVYSALSTDELEYELWLALGTFLRDTKSPVSPVLLGLLPLEIEEWPAEFATSMLPIVKDFEDYDAGSNCTTSLSHDFVRLSPHYPKHRRQRRLSYNALYLLEEKNDKYSTQLLREQMLKTPSTRQRLRLALEKFNTWQEAKWGEFQ